MSSLTYDAGARCNKGAWPTRGNSRETESSHKRICSTPDPLPVPDPVTVRESRRRCLCLVGCSQRQKRSAKMFFYMQVKGVFASVQTFWPAERLSQWINIRFPWRYSA